MCDPIRETTTIVEQLLQSLQRINQINQQFRNQTSDSAFRNNSNESEREHQRRLVQIHSLSMQTSSNFVNEIIQFNNWKIL